jgi:hypothetical protein
MRTKGEQLLSSSCQGIQSIWIDCNRGFAGLAGCCVALSRRFARRGIRAARRNRAASLLRHVIAKGRFRSLMAVALIEPPAGLRGNVPVVFCSICAILGAYWIEVLSLFVAW